METYGELLKSLIEHYEKAVIKLPKCDDKRDIYLNYKNIGWGICFTSTYEFNVDIYGSIFSYFFTKGGMVYKQYPIRQNYETAKELLQTRIDRMKEVLPEWENVSIN